MFLLHLWLYHRHSTTTTTTTIITMPITDCIFNYGFDLISVRRPIDYIYPTTCRNGFFHRICWSLANGGQPGVPSQPNNFRATDIGETTVTLQWSKPTHSSENIVHYELYWNDTYANKDLRKWVPWNPIQCKHFSILCWVHALYYATRRWLISLSQWSLH